MPAKVPHQIAKLRQRDSQGQMPDFSSLLSDLCVHINAKKQYHNDTSRFYSQV